MMIQIKVEGDRGDSHGSGNFYFVEFFLKKGHCSLVLLLLLLKYLLINCIVRLYC
jgi:hypothetical protein